MSSNTPNLALRKPDPSDLVNVTADLSENMDKIDTAVAAKATSAALAAHEADATSIHGITDTAALETAAGATAKVAAHEADTTSVHGITDTAALATAGSVTSAVSTHAALGDPHPGYVLESLIDAAGDLIVGTADNTVGRLAKGSALDVLRVNAGATALEFAAASGGSAILQQALEPGSPASGDLWLDTDEVAQSGTTALVQNAQTGTTYTPVLTDDGKLVEYLNAAPIAVTVPTNASVPYPVGAQIHGVQTGAGQVTVAGDSGVTVNGTPGLKARAQWSAFTLIKRATNTWLLVGDLAA